MKSADALEKILKSFEQYYTVSTVGVPAPFCAEAVFKSHNEQYFLVKAAKVADIDSNEFVYFYDNAVFSSSLSNGGIRSEQAAEEESLSPNRIDELSQVAWEQGLSKVTPYYGHRNSDVTLIILSEIIPDESFKQIKKLNHYKSYKFGLYGWSSFRALAYETSTGRAVTNRRGSDLKKLVASL